MATSKWHEKLVAAFHRQALPSAYIERLISELTDHAEDILKEQGSMNMEEKLTSRLGHPNTIAENARQEYVRRTFAGRNPLLTFVAGPPLVLLSIFLAMLFVGESIYWLIDALSSGSLTANDHSQLPPSILEMRVLTTLNEILRFSPFAIAALLFARLSVQAGRNVWGVIACGLVAITALFFFAVVQLQAGSIQGNWIIGFTSVVTINQLAQAAIPMALTAWSLWKMSRNDKINVLAT